MPTPEDVREICRNAALKMGRNASDAEIAFFGGSFTAIPLETMKSLLKAAALYVKDGPFSGIRVSTRPDSVDEHKLGILKSYGVTAVELGVQSMDDNVLKANGRGHTSGDVVRAAALIHESGLQLGLQMMTGLYKSSDSADIKTAQELAKLRPSTVRIYPTLVMEHTVLARLYRAGVYKPQSLEHAVRSCARLLYFFESVNGISVIRLGLHADAKMQSSIVAGPWHPAFRELCEGTLYYEMALKKLRQEIPAGGSATLLVNPKAISRMVGHKRCNILRLADAGYCVKVRGSPQVKPMNVKVNK